MTGADPRNAERTLVAVCAHLALARSPRDENFALWRATLRDVLADCGQCAEPLEPFRALAIALVGTEGVHTQDRIIGDLRIAAHAYFRDRAAAHFEAWREAHGAYQ